MKKFIPILSLIGASALIVGCSNLGNENKNNIVENIKNFETSLNNYTKVNEDVFNTNFDKYKLKVSSLDDATLVNTSNQTDQSSTSEEFKENEINNNLEENNLTLQKLKSEVEDLTNNNEITFKDNKNSESMSNSDNKLNINDYLLDDIGDTAILNDSNTNDNSIINDSNDVNNEDNNSNSSNNENDNSNITNNENNNSLDSENNSISNDINNEQLSTLYSLSNDIKDSCDEFCTLKQNITNAIIETQNLIKKINSNEINLSSEQRLLITEQSQQLKNLSKQLSNITNELSFNLSDINQFLRNNDYDNLNMKYLVVLNNLIDGNEMLANGLYTLNMINNMSALTNPNTNGKIIYRYKENNSPETIKEYTISDGKIIENNNNTENLQNTENTENDEQENQNSSLGNVDTYMPSLKSNIDTYRPLNPYSNIDSFFNTAHLDNEFMYGNNAFNNFNPYFNNFNNSYNYPYNNTNYGVFNNQIPQNIQNYNNNLNDNNIQNNYNDQNNDINQNGDNLDKKERNRKPRKIKKNIDTFKDKNTPTLKTRYNNIKNSVTNFFNNIKNNKSDIK